LLPLQSVIMDSLLVHSLSKQLTT